MNFILMHNYNYCHYEISSNYGILMLCIIHLQFQWEKKHNRKSDLFRKKGGLIGPVCGCVASAPHGFHMGHSHTKYCQLVRFPGQRAACRHHVWKLSDVLSHFVASASFNLTVVFSKTETIGVISLESSWQPLSCYAPDPKFSIQYFNDRMLEFTKQF